MVGLTLTFNERVKGVCDSLTDDLRSIDINTNWSASYFTPLDAEVEISTSKGKERKVTDLLKAIRGSKDRLFLVLGDPGSGKSVALRKLCQDLASEVEKTGKIPIYLNLREWHLEEKWTEKNQPTVQQLYDFAFDKVKERDISTGKFFKKYFDRLYDTGHLYFVLDSFDEIPAILAEPDGSELIKQVSDVIFRFLKGGRQFGSQGILASRIFRKPTQEFQTKVTLELRPFTEEKIISTFKSHDIFSEEIIKKLFRDRPELIPVARNPLSATLIAEYIENNDNELPNNQSDMYADYFSRTLDSCYDKITKKQLTKDQVIRYTIEIASTMFSRHGLEVPLIKITDELSSIPVEDIIDILVFARIGRIGTGDNSLFSFSHRRFIEYFSVQKMISDGYQIDLETIPSDSQWRDTLVLYCEVASEEKVVPIADYCWSVIQSSESVQNMRVIHSMRFLADAFKGRRGCLTNFIDDLAKYTFHQINEFNSILNVKIALETVSILDEFDRDQCICKAFEIENPILESSVINSSRNLSTISRSLSRKITNIITRMGAFNIFKRRHSLIFSLSLSDAFGSIKRKVKILNYLVFLWLIFLFINSIINLGFLILVTLFMLPIILDSDDHSNKKSGDDVLIFLFALISISYFLFMQIEISPTNKSSTIYNIKNTLNYSVISLNPEIKSLLMLSSITLNFLVLMRGALFLDVILVKIIDIRKNIKITLFYITILIASILVINIIGEERFLKTSSYLIFILLPLAIFSSIYVLYNVIISTIDFNKERKNLNKSKLNQRGYIYNMIMNSRTYRFKLYVVEYLEENILDVNGEWPDIDILRAYKTDDVTIRLAALEEKWLGLDR